MVDVVEVLCAILVAVALVPALAHALEWPGKARLPREAYFVVQPIYYPGFTFAGAGEPLAIVAVVVLALLAPEGSAYFWLACVAVACLAGMHAIFWLFTQPVNRFWLREQELGRLGSKFFAVDDEGGRDVRTADTVGSGQATAGPERVDWTRLRDTWERSHCTRAVLASVSFVALVVAIATHDL